MIKEIKIGNKKIGDNYPCFIIAEAGSNHNGSLKQAKELIDVAAWAGTDAIKFQIFRAEKMYPQTKSKVKYLRELGVSQPIYEIIKKAEMSYEWIPKLANYCKRKNIIFLSSAFDEKSVDVLEPYVLAFKIASYEMTDIPLVQYIAKKGKPIICSTGAADLKEISKTFNSILKTRNNKICVMQCIAKYPTPVENLNLRVIKTLKKKFRTPVGLSDHSRDPIIGPVCSIGAGANLIEKHFTLSNKLPGPDHRFAIEPHELKEMVKAIRLAEKALGSFEKKLQEVEVELVNYRRSLFTIKPISRKEIFTKENVAILRKPGIKNKGIEPENISRVLGKKSKKDLPKYHLLKAIDIKGY